MNVIDSNILERDAGGKPLHTFPHPALAVQALEPRQEPLLGLACRPWRQIVVDHRRWQAGIAAEQVGSTFEVATAVLRP